MALGLALGLAFPACQGSSPRVLSASPEVVAERSAQTVVLDTSGCAPVFDLDRGGATPEGVASLVLGDDAGVLAVRRTLDEQFEANVPPDLLPGSYEMTLVLGDGRRAAYTGRLRVEPLAVQIDAVRSTRSGAVLGESGLPLSVSLSNPGQCAVQGLAVVPVFTRDGADVSGDFSVSASGPVSLAPGGAATVDFTVALGLSATPGVVQIDARASGGARVGSPGCTGIVSAAGAASVQRWVIVAPAQAMLVVASVSATPETPHPGGQFNVNATIRNNAAVPLTLATLDLSSSPQGLIISAPPHLNTQPLDPGGTVSYTLHATVPTDAPTGRVYIVSVTATARDDAGNVYASAVPAPETTVTVR